MKDNSTGKDKEFYALGNRVYERLNPPPVDWVETNNKVCKILRQVHDMLALASFPPKREWVGLTDEEIHDTPGYQETREMYRFALALESKLKEKNND